MKYKIVMTMFLLVVLILGFGITYSLFTSSGTMNSNDQNIAKFVFEAETVDYLELALVDLKPGESEIYEFSVANNLLGNLSQVAVEYQLIIKTYHFVPLDIALYKIDGETETWIMDCDETYSRNGSNELVCNSAVQDMGYDTEALDNYEIRVSFPTEYNGEEYSNLIDYLNVEIKSWQKISE